jgi:DNA-binding XRE family transcriptional regulator
VSAVTATARALEHVKQALELLPDDEAHRPYRAQLSIAVRTWNWPAEGRHVASTGQRIRIARLDAGLTQVELAELAGTDRSTVSRAETGARQAATLSLSTIVRFAQVLGVRADDLVGEADWSAWTKAKVAS